MKNELNVRINTLIEKSYYELMASVNGAIENWIKEEEERKREDKKNTFYLLDGVLDQIIECKYNPTTNEMTVPKGSAVRESSVPSQSNSDSRHYGPTRDKLIVNGVISMENGKFILTRDYTFSAPSQAASVILGRPENGRDKFLSATSTPLGEVYPIQDKEVVA